MGSLAVNDLTNYGKDMSGILAIVEALKSGMAVLKNLNVSQNSSISGDAARQLAAAALGSASLEVLSEVPIKELREDMHTSLDLCCKKLGPTEGFVIAELTKVSAVLTNLNLNNNQLGPEGGAAIAKALEVNKVLKKCAVQYNQLGDTEQMLRDAWKDREAFELLV